jgi:hypothetical protein
MDAVDARRLIFPAQQDEQRKLNRRRSLASGRSCARSSVSGVARPVANYLPIRAQDAAGRRSDRSITVCRCALVSRLTAGPPIISTEAPASRPRQASARPAASSAGRSHPTGQALEPALKLL